MADQKRIILWTTPRTLSTAFTRAMMSRDSCKVLVEPSVKQFYLGEEAIYPILKPGQDKYPNCTWKDLYNELNDPYEGYREVFAKEMPYRFRNFLDNIEEKIPSNYIHAFLIRNPHRTMPSFYNMLEEERDKDALPEISWMEMEKVHNWIAETKGYQPFVIDADELQKDPETVLRHFCQAVGIDYQDTMVNWTPIPEDCMEQLKIYEDYFQLAMSTDKFLPSTPKAFVKDDKLSEDVIRAITKAMPYYLKFKERSFKFRS